MTQPGTFQYYFINSSPNFRVQRTNPPTRRPSRFKLNYEKHHQAQAKITNCLNLPKITYWSSIFLKIIHRPPKFPKIILWPQNLSELQFDPKLINYILTFRLFSKIYFHTQNSENFPKAPRSWKCHFIDFNANFHQNK